MMKSSDYIESLRKEFALYVITNRAIPAITDGIKPAARRVLWTARDGKKHKSASLAGATLPLHPHSPPEGTINTLAAPYGNNYPLLKGYGAFGTCVNNTAYAASRYTSVEVSEFAKQILFKDIELVPMMENYDSTLMEPVHFLPIVPIVLLNPADGIAVGFSTTIAPRKLQDVVDRQLDYLKGKKVTPTTPTFLPTNDVATHRDSKWVFKGEVVRKNASNVTITRIPFGTSHAKILQNDNSKLNKLLDVDAISDYEDRSRDSISIDVQFKRGEAGKLSDDQLLTKLGLVVNVSENLNVLDFTHKTVMGTNDVEIITTFTEWRLGWYVARYERLKSIIEDDIQKEVDIITAIDQQAGLVATKKQTKKDFDSWLQDIGIVNVSYISGLPTYRYTLDERAKVEKSLTTNREILSEYVTILGSEDIRRAIYINELKDIKKQFTGAVK